MKRYDMLPYTKGSDSTLYPMPTEDANGAWVSFYEVQEELAAAWDDGLKEGVQRAATCAGLDKSREWHDMIDNPYRKQEKK
jgi:hypothetical protein